MNKRILILIAFVVANVSLVVGLLVTKSHKKVEQDTSVSSSMPEISYPNLDNEVISIADIPEPVIFINFWATWCKPCSKEIPVLNEIQEQYKGRVKIVAISLDTMERSKLFLESLDISLLTLISNQNVFTLMADMGNTNGAIPFSVLVNEKREIRYAALGELSLEDIVSILESCDCLPPVPPV